MDQKIRPHPVEFRKIEESGCQYRPQGSTKEVPFYDPQRDVAHLVDPLIRAVYYELLHDDWFDRECEIGGVTKAELLPALLSLHKMVHMDALNEGDIGKLWKVSGLDEHEPKVLQVAFACLGQAFMAASWRGKRAAAQVTPDGQTIGMVESGQETAELALEIRGKLWDREWDKHHSSIFKRWISSVQEKFSRLTRRSKT